LVSIINNFGIVNVLFLEKNFDFSVLETIKDISKYKSFVFLKNKCKIRKLCSSGDYEEINLQLSNNNTNLFSSLKSYKELLIFKILNESKIKDLTDNYEFVSDTFKCFLNSIIKKNDELKILKNGMKSKLNLKK
jgi:hypothetical protein